MPSFRKRPVVIEAMCWDGSLASGDAIRAAFGGAVQVHAEKDDPRPPRLYCETLEGLLAASVGDWIIRGVKGEVYPCKPDIFAATYDPADFAPVDARQWCLDRGHDPQADIGGMDLDYVLTEYAAATAPATPPSTPNAPTVRVRIAVSVSPGGDWAAAGGVLHSELDCMEATGHHEGDRLSWVTADVPVPVSEPVGTVTGHVEASG